MRLKFIKMQPVFICGHIKTGTSLLSSLLDGHPQLSVFPEELFLYPKLNKLKKEKKYSYSEFWTMFFADHQIAKLFGGKSEGFFGNVDYSMFDAKAFKTKCIQKTSNFQTNKIDPIVIYTAILESYTELTNPNESKKWVEKTPMNELQFFTWKKAFPTARFIYMHRNPIHVFTSVKKKRIKENIKYSILNFLVNFKTSQEVAFRLEKEYKHHFKIIQFEDLVSNPKKCMEDISDFLAIKYSDILLSPTKLGVPWLGNSMFEKKSSGKIFKESNSKERDELISFDERKWIENFILKNKSPIFEYRIARQNFKSYLKLVSMRVRIFLFMTKIKSI